MSAPASSRSSSAASSGQRPDDEVAFSPSDESDPYGDDFYSDHSDRSPPSSPPRPAPPPQVSPRGKAKVAVEEIPRRVAAVCYVRPFIRPREVVGAVPLRTRGGLCRVGSKKRGWVHVLTDRAVWGVEQCPDPERPVVDVPAAVDEIVGPAVETATKGGAAAIVTYGGAKSGKTTLMFGGGTCGEGLVLSALRAAFAVTQELFLVCIRIVNNQLLEVGSNSPVALRNTAPNAFEVSGPVPQRVKTVDAAKTLLRRAVSQVSAADRGPKDFRPGDPPLGRSALVVVCYVVRARGDVADVVGANVDIGRITFADLPPSDWAAATAKVSADQIATMRRQFDSLATAVHAAVVTERKVSASKSPASEVASKVSVHTRESVLNRLLSSAMVGGSVTIVGCCSPRTDHADTSLATLRYIHRIKAYTAGETISGSVEGSVDYDAEVSAVHRRLLGRTGRDSIPTSGGAAVLRRGGIATTDKNLRVLLRDEAQGRQQIFSELKAKYVALMRLEYQELSLVGRASPLRSPREGVKWGMLDAATHVLMQFQRATGDAATLPPPPTHKSPPLLRSSQPPTSPSRPPRTLATLASPTRGVGAASPPLRGTSPTTAALAAPRAGASPRGSPRLAPLSPKAPLPPARTLGGPRGTPPAAPLPPPKPRRPPTPSSDDSDAEDETPRKKIPSHLSSRRQSAATAKQASSDGHKSATTPSSGKRSSKSSSVSSNDAKDRALPKEHSHSYSDESFEGSRLQTETKVREDPTTENAPPHHQGSHKERSGVASTAPEAEAEAAADAVEGEADAAPAEKRRSTVARSQRASRVASTAPEAEAEAAADAVEGEADAAPAEKRRSTVARSQRASRVANTAPEAEAEAVDSVFLTSLSPEALPPPGVSASSRRGSFVDPGNVSAQGSTVPSVSPSNVAHGNEGNGDEEESKRKDESAVEPFPVPPPKVVPAAKVSPTQPPPNKAPVPYDDEEDEEFEEDEEEEEPVRPPPKAAAPPKVLPRPPEKPPPRPPVQESDEEDEEFEEEEEDKPPKPVSKVGPAKIPAKPPSKPPVPDDDDDDEEFEEEEEDEPPKPVPPKAPAAFKTPTKPAAPPPPTKAPPRSDPVTLEDLYDF